MGSEYLHFGLNLLAVLSLMIFLAYLLKRVRQVKNEGNKQIKVVNVVSIGAKEKIILLEVNGSALLIGATANHIATLHRFDEMNSIDTKTTIEPVFKEELLKLME